MSEEQINQNESAMDTAAPPAEAPKVDAEKPSGPSPLERRMRAMESIEQLRTDQLTSEGVDVSRPADDTPPPAEASRDEAPQPAPPKVESETVEVVVDGQKMAVPKAVVDAAGGVRNFQVGQAADRRLQAATEALRKLQEREAAIELREQELRKRAEEPVREKTPDQAVPDGNIDWQAAAEKLQYGTKEEAAAVLRDTVAKLQQNTQANQPGVSAEELERKVLDRMEWNSALKEFGEQFPDVLKDQVLSGIAGDVGRRLYENALKQAQATGAPRPAYRDLFFQAGNLTRQWFHQRAGAAGYIPKDQPAPTANPTRVQANVSTSRQDAKRSMPTPNPRSGPPSAAQKIADSEKTELESRRSAIEEMAKRRRPQVA